MRIWIVDDKIPLEHLYSGPYPTRLEAAMVLELVSSHADKWDKEEQSLLSLCRAACEGGHAATFFRAPDAMRIALNEGVRPPHAVVFDWEYPGSNPECNVAVLRHLLSSTFAYVQVYTNLGGEAVEMALAELRAEFPTRLLPARGKSEVDADGLTAQIDAAWKNTIAGEISDKVRDVVSSAVEQCLIDMCAVPKQALAAIAGPQAHNLQQLILSKVREEISGSGMDILNEIIKGGGIGVDAPALRKLMSVWYYAFHSDDWVRRGDVIEIDGGLGLVVTPACDLAEFHKKAGSRLTWLRIVPFTVESLNTLAAHGFQFDNVGGSITAQHGRTGEAMVILPNMPTVAGDRERLEDFVVLCHGWESKHCEFVEKGRVKYPRLPGVVRRCTVAEPFVSAAIARASAVITAPAVPDLPKSEKLRLATITTPKRPEFSPKPPPVASPAAPPEGVSNPLASSEDSSALTSSNSTT